MYHWYEVYPLPASSRSLPHAGELKMRLNGGGGGVIVTVPVAVVIHPAPLVAVTVTLYDRGPGGGNVCVGF